MITLTTDFGYTDPFVGMMKGVILGIHPEVQILDLCHGVAPQNILAGALVLRHSLPYFRRGTVHVVVVDPGVGGARRPILIESDGHYFVGPDNGVFSLALEGKDPSCMVHLSNSRYHLTPTSTTFHGRDIFAPVAAYLSLGIPPPDFGERITTLQRLSWPGVVKDGRRLLGQVIYVDRFGNLFTNITERDLAELSGARSTIRIGKISISGLVQNYASGEQGGLMAIINSWGLMEIALYKGSAQDQIRAEIGQRIKVTAES
jgi:S-adenosylmethionine hydrolase